MAYIKKETRAGDRIRIEKYYSSRYGSKGRSVRAENFNKTPAEMKRRNLRYAKMKADDIFCENFKAGDLTITFTFTPEKRPKNTAELKIVWQKYIRQARSAYKKAGKTFRWMKGIDISKNNPHIHAAFTSIDIKLLPKWKYGKIHINPIDDREHHTFGAYLVQQGVPIDEKKQQLEGESLFSYSHSRNCIIPQPKITIISNDHWCDEPRAPQGWIIVKDSLQNWHDEYNGYRHQSYLIIKIPTCNKRRSRCDYSGA